MIRSVRYEVASHFCTMLVVGETTGTPLVLLHGGWPDDHSVFLPLAQHLASEGMLCGVITMPGFSDAELVASASDRNAHFTLEDACAGIQAAGDALRAESGEAKAPLHLVLHDWGCFVGFVQVNLALKNEVERIVAFDVAPPPPRSMWPSKRSEDESPRGGRVPPYPIRLWQTFLKLNYQFFLALTYLVGITLGSTCASILLFFGCAVLRSPGLGALITPVVPDERPPRALNSISWRMSWPYYDLMRRFLCGGRKKDSLLRNFRLVEGLPTLFVFGKDKNVNFHTQETLDALHEAKWCDWRAMSGGHWVMQAHPEAAAQLAGDFIRQRKYKG